MKLTTEILEQAAADYDMEKYSAELYQHGLNILAEAKDPVHRVSSAIRELFYWKLGKAKGKRTGNSTPLTFVDSRGHQFYGVREIMET